MKYPGKTASRGAVATEPLTKFLNKFSVVLLLVLLVSASAGNVRGDEHFTRKEFSRLSVLERARFFENAILTAAINEDVDPNLLWTIAYNETRFRPWLRSPAGAEGLMQFIPATAARYDLTNPYESVAAIKASARYVRFLSRLFDGRIDSVLAAYNAGEGTVSAYLDGRAVRSGSKIINSRSLRTIGGVPPYAETIGYVGRGLIIYRWMIERGVFPAKTATARFPNVISASVARVNLSDAELGLISQFETKRLIPIVYQSSSTIIVTSQNNGLETALPINSTLQTRKVVRSSAASENETSFDNETLSGTEIYYDLLTGNRYLIQGEDEAVKLAENGQVIVSPFSRKIATIARSTFAGSTKKSR